LMGLVAKALYPSNRRRAQGCRGIGARGGKRRRQVDRRRWR
jgi:hypothetical protein